MDVLLRRIDGFTRRLLLTPEGRRTLAVAYIVLGCIGLVAYWITQTPGYTLVMAGVIAFGLWWARFCLRRA